MNACGFIPHSGWVETPANAHSLTRWTSQQVGELKWDRIVRLLRECVCLREDQQAPRYLKLTPTIAPL